MFPIRSRDSCAGSWGVLHIWNAPAFHSLVVVECFPLLWGNWWHFLTAETNAERTSLTSEPTPLDWLSPHKGREEAWWTAWQAALRVSFDFPHLLPRSSVYEFPKVYTISGPRGVGGFCQASNPLMDRRLVYSPKNAHKVFAVSCGA